LLLRRTVEFVFIVLSSVFAQKYRIMLQVCPIHFGS